MNCWRAAALAAALVAAAGLGAAMMPAAHGQTRVERPAPAVRAVQILGGGSHIGVSIRDLDEAQAKKTPAGAGVVIEDVTAEGPAAQAGIRKGDILLEFDGERVRSARQLTRLVHETPAGRTVQAALLRDGQRTTVSVVPREGGRARLEGFEDLAEWGREFGARIAPAIPAVPAPPAPPSPRAPGWDFDELTGRTGRLGISVRALTPQLAEYFGVREGVLVSAVTENSVAAKAGIRAGDVITAIEGTSVSQPADVRRQTQTLKADQEFAITVMRDRKEVTLKGKLELPETRRSTRISV